MRKYIKLSLFLMALLSFVLMFIYRQKYSKLSLVFELMNAFQFNESKTKCNNELYEFKKLLKSDFLVQEQMIGTPYWTEIFPGLYVYSSYMLSKATRTLVITKNVPLSSLGKLHCKLSYENFKTAKNSSSTIHLIDRKLSLYFLFLDCQTFENKVPRSISFTYENSSSSVAFPIISQQSFVGPYVICAKPFPPDFENVHKILEFITYHSHIGVQYFIFYDTGIPFAIKKLLLEIALKSGIYVLLLPWNLPHGFDTAFVHSDIYFIDCLHRAFARNLTSFVLNLDLNHFIVPQNDFKLSTLTKVFSPGLSIGRLEERRFCAEYSNDGIVQNLNISFITLLKTKVRNEYGLDMSVVYDVLKWKKEIRSRATKIHLLKKNSQRSVLVDKSLAVIHSYAECGRPDLEKEVYVEDKEMWKYKDVLFKSHIYLLAKDMGLVNN